MTRVALVNPRWDFTGSIYFGCQAPHLPLELGYARALLEAAGHDVVLIDAHLFDRSLADVRDELAIFRPALTVVTTAPTYLFWRCPPPELRVPMQTIAALRDVAGTIVAVGPHASVTPRATLAKLGAGAAVIGECEDVLVALAGTPRDRWAAIPSLAVDDRTEGESHAVAIDALPALSWTGDEILRHTHHHHRFDAPPVGPGAELEATRGCPFHCTFRNKEAFRDRYRKRPLAVVLDELDGLIAQGVEYVYFIDEIFPPDRALLEALVDRQIGFGVQLRIDLWDHEMLDLLGRAGCRSIEAGVESVTPAGRSLLEKRCRLDSDQLAELLIVAKRRIPFVQANLIASPADDPAQIASWTAQLEDHGVWANVPVPLFPYPGTPDYRLRWGRPDDTAWERAHAHYLASFSSFSDLQAARPLPLAQLESPHG